MTPPTGQRGSRRPAIDSLLLAAIATEVWHAAGERRLGPVVVPAPNQAALGLPSGALAVSIAADDPRCHLVDRLPDGPAVTPGIQSHLDSLLRGGELVACRTVEFDRVMELTVDNLDRVGRPRTYRVLIEIMGKHSALSVIDEQAEIVATLRTVTSEVNRHRELLPGQLYIGPPAGGRSDPLQLDWAAFLAAWPELCAAESLERGWRACWHGLSPLLWEHLTRVAELPTDARGEVVDQDTARRLFAAWDDVRQRVLTGVFAPHQSFDELGRPVKVYPLPFPGGEPVASVSAPLARWASQARADQRLAQRRSLLTDKLNHLIRRAGRRREELAGLLDRADRADQWSHQADLILANLHQIGPRASSVEVADWNDPDGGLVRLELDPQLTGPQNAEQLYERARRARRTAAEAPERIEATAAEAAAAESLLAQVERASDLAELDHLAVAVAKLAGESGKDQRPAKPRTERERWQQKLERRTSSDGYTIFIGKNSRESEGLLSRVAAPTDLWFHVRGAGSGHVIVRTEGRPDQVPPQTIAEAARWAARNSKMKHSGLVPVVYTQRKYVTKVTGGAAGKVVYRHEKSIFVDPNG